MYTYNMFVPVSSLISADLHAKCARRLHPCL